MKYGNGIINQGTRKAAAGFIECASPRVAITFDKDTFKKIAAEARGRKVSFATVVRSLLSQALSGQR